MIEPRESIKEFAVKMEEVLRKHDEKGGWEYCSTDFLIKEIADHLDKAIEYPYSGDVISQRNWIDVANYAMMLYEHSIGGESGRVNGRKP